MVNKCLVILNDAEQKLAKYVAKGRYKNARSNGVKDGKMGDQSNWQTDLEGVAAEIAYCKYANLYPDLEIDDPANLPIHDSISPKGHTIDVKSTTYEDGKLLAVIGKVNKRCNIYVLVTGRFPDYLIKGWATEHMLFIPENIGDLGHGKGYMLVQDDIHKFNTK